MRLTSKLAFLMALASSATAGAAGFQLGEEGAQATGMAGAFTAKADDPSALFYNPAGLARMRGLQLYVGGMLVIGQTAASSTSTFALPEGRREGFVSVAFIPNLYLSYGLPKGFAVGIGAFTNFGLKSIWPADWSGRFISQFANLETVTINPTIAWSPVSWFSIGGGFDVTPGRVELRREEYLVNAESQLQFRGNAVGYGGNVGVLLKSERHGWLPGMSLGVSYRSRYNMNFNDAVLKAYNVPLELSPVLHDSKASTNIPMPDLVSVGVGMRPTDGLFLQAQFDYTNWKRLQQLELKTDSPGLGVTLPQNWRDGYTVRVGAEYAWSGAAVRVGGGYDWAPVPSSTLGPIVPDADRILVSGGFSAHMTHSWALDFAAMGVIFRGRTSALPELPVRYDTWAVLFSGGIRYQAPQKVKTHAMPPHCVPCTTRPRVPPPPPVETAPPVYEPAPPTEPEMEPETPATPEPMEEPEAP